MAMVSLPAIWPFLNFLNTNRDESYSLSWLGLYGLGTLLATCIGFLIFRKIFGRVLSWGRAGAIFSVGVISFFCYSLTYSFAYELWRGYYLKSWAAFAIVMFLLAWYLSRSRLFQDLVLVLGAVLAVVPTAQYLGYQIQISIAGEENAGERTKVVSVENAKNLPSVFHIILDEYGRADVLQAIYGFDNSEFLERLSARGFYVADKAMSNYGRTGLSVPSVLTMDYLFQGEATPQVMAEAKRLLNGSGPVFEWFQDAGYYTAQLNYIGSYCGPDLPDYCYTASGIQYGELESNLIALTPLNSLANLLIDMNIGLKPKYYELWDAQDFVAGLKTEKPVFAHIHMLIPHTPHRFTRTCDPISPAQQNSNRDSYIENLECANTESLKLIDTILQRDPNSIIILQADHGLRAGISTGNWKTDDTWEQAFSILNAWRIPPSLDCGKELHPRLTAVNTFRIVQGCLSGAPPDLLSERWFHEEKINSKYIEIFRK